MTKNSRLPTIRIEGWLHRLVKRACLKDHRKIADFCRLAIEERVEKLIPGAIERMRQEPEEVNEDERFRL